MKKVRRTCWHRLEVAVSSKSIIVSAEQREGERQRARAAKQPKETQDSGKHSILSWGAEHEHAARARSTNTSRKAQLVGTLLDDYGDDNDDWNGFDGVENEDCV